MSTLRSRSGSFTAHTGNNSMMNPAISTNNYSKLMPNGTLRSRWSAYNWTAMSRTKSTAIVLAEAAEDNSNGSEQLDKCLGLWDIVSYGVGSTIGSGIFVTTGVAALSAGPGIVLSFILASLSCLFSAFCYCEFAARVPVSGSAYTFAYVCLGELAAWFIGWNLTLEYAISAAAVAAGWAENLVVLVNQSGGSVPYWLHDIPINGGGAVVHSLSLLAAAICLLCMGILLIGVKESSRFNMIITIMNVACILFIIIAGSTKVNKENWYIAPKTADQIPPGCSGDGGYFPCGLNGVLTGAAQVFFSYIGFDAVTTLAEEVKNPKRDLPIGIIITLGISSALYISVALVITGMNPWYAMDQKTPLATAFQTVGMNWASTLVAAVTVTGLTASVLTSLFGQPRIFYRMAKDGLLFKLFGVIDPRTKAPLWGTVVTGIGAAIIALLFDISTLSQMISIGTLMAFSTVCAGVVILRYQTPDKQRQLLLESINQQNSLLLDQSNSNMNNNNNNPDQSSDSLMSPLSPNNNTDFQSILYCLPPNHLINRIYRTIINHWAYNSAAVWLLLFLLPCIALCVCLGHLNTTPIAIPIIFLLLSIIPVIRLAYLPVDLDNLPGSGQFLCPAVPYLPCLGIFTNVYLIASLDFMSYVRIAVWTVIGFSIYFGYGILHSRLTRSINAAADAESDHYNNDNNNNTVDIESESTGLTISSVSIDNRNNSTDSSPAAIINGNGLKH